MRRRALELKFFESWIQEMYHPVLGGLRILDPQLIWPTATIFNYVYRERKGFCRTENREELQKVAKAI